MASERDFTEAIRGGLPNGSNTLVATWDIALGAAPNTVLRNTGVKWTGVDKNFTDVYPTYMTWFGTMAVAAPFRCMWTNELR